MNTKIFRQYDGPWAKKPYPTKGCTVSGAGCGLVACTHIAIEQEDKKNWTPETLRPYMLKYAVAGQGTTWNGITKTLEYLGHKVKYITEATPMKDAFAELNKGNRIGIILFYGGYSKRYKKWYKTPDGTVWTSNGHYIMFGNYKYENGKHWFYLKDSGGRKHDGWYSYESSMKGCVGQMWIVERVGAQTTSPKATTADGKLVVDGVGGVATVKAMQRFLGVTQDGIISSQNKNLKKFYPALKSVSFADSPKGSATIKMLQKWLGISPDGILGKTTIVALQKKLGLKDPDGVLGPNTMKALQLYLNNNSSKVITTKATTTPTKTPSLTDKLLDACKIQSAWMKNAEYKWESKPTVEKSKKKGTCVTYVACVLQRIGYLSSGSYIWQNGRGFGDGKVYGTTNKMTVTYMGNKTLSSLKNKLKAGDIVMVDDNKSGNKGGGGHIFVLTGKWSGNDPYIWDNETAKKGQKARTYSGSRKVLAVVRLKSTATTSPSTSVKTWSDNANSWARSIAKQKYHYVRWKGGDAKTHTCPICSGRKYNNAYGWNCIGFAYACWHHGGKLGTKCNCGVIANEVADKLLRVTQAEANKMASSRVGKNVTVVRNGGKAVPLSKLKPGDICLLYKGSKYYHTIYYMGNGKYAESNTTGGIGHANNIRADLSLSSTAKKNLKVAIRPI